MKNIYLLIIASLSTLSLCAQKNGSVKGSLYDSVAKQPVASATITVLQKKDSSLVTFTMTDSKGRFEITQLANGDYRLLITHVNYHGSNKTFSIDDANKNRDLGNLILHDAAQMLNEVVVTAEAPPVTLIGDTVQYNAGSFKTPPNANVEQLLKKMPGIQVEKDGTVKAQGQEVKRVLVDGKEFFGTDPKIATRNLPSDAVDKVQVYDKSSDAAQLTGFDDGNSEKTINLKLKKDKKKGLFGKASVGAGTSDRYEGRFNLNSFKGARQLSVIGMGNNTNAEGFSFMDMLSFSGQLSGGRQNGGVMTITSNDPSVGGFAGGNNNNSIRTIWGGGLNYNNIIGNNTDFTSNYFYNRYNPKIEKETQQQNFLPDGSILTKSSNSLSDNINNSHKLNLSADIKLDSFHSIKISPSLGYQSTNNNNISEYATRNQHNTLANQGINKSLSASDGYNFRNEILFRKRFRTRGRTFSLTLTTNLNASDGDGSQLSVNKFFNPDGSALGTDSINQFNAFESDLLSYNARAVYTEPIMKNTLLEFSVSNSLSKSTSAKTTWDYNRLNGKYDAINDALSNHYENTYEFTNGGIRWRSQFKKWNFAAGANWQKADLEGNIIAGTKDSLIKQTFYNILPSARFQYNFTKFKNLQVNYNAMTNQPSMTQLSPVADISNPLNIREGNPDLQQEYTHLATINFMSVNPFRNKNLFAYFNIRQTNNKIVSYDSINAQGIKRTRPINVDGVFNLNGTVSLGLPVRFLKGTVNISSNVGYDRNKQYINGAGNTINTTTLGPSLRLDMSPTGKFDVSLNAGINYNRSEYSLQSSLNTTYFSQNYGTDINWQLPKSFYFNTEFTYMLNNRLADGFNLRVPLWNASISKQFLRFNRGELKLTAFDLLNENVNISRTSNQNYIEDNRVTTLRRYFLLSFTYSLSKMGLDVASPAPGSFRIMR
ncbi:outer membrane beta-barrel family protein [Paraflavitalea sp. CAU 1676]|uniref:outer membrane beta-barrel protein n=1 Tax=Paraflavitalea sp. CAU 1676 TaxID=3032598 RepID=UPI0023D9AE52|nr:outer membrane beta-barrel family protein [Paraflavitalea sp. CAU 1676]MDF2190938.1 outer membrane beta-barrel family protein [Paraflavitalea sp. CAU 1676]